MGISNAVFQQFVELTRGHATREPEELHCHAYDAGGYFSLPDALAYPSSKLEVSKLLDLASKEGICVVPRGSGSGMTGGTVPVQGGLVMGMSRMNKILDIDQETLTAKVEPGVITGEFHRAVEKKGLFYPPDPASSAFCTIGGNLGECAGGPRAVKYGVTRDYVLGLEVVMASGEIIHTGVRTAKGVAGYDLTRLIVGSEGTLGVITEVSLKLLPLPEMVKTMAVFFSDMRLAANTVSSLIREGLTPRCVEFMDRSSILCVEKEFGFELPEDIQSILIIEVDGSSQVVEEDARRANAFCMKNGAVRVITADDPVQTATLWKARKALSSSMYKIAPNKINEDIVVPINRIPDMLQSIEGIKNRTKLSIVSFGHAGDGNIHCNIMYDKKDKNQSLRAKSALDDLFSETLKLGGTITGEHGVGLSKMQFLPLEIGACELEIMKGIKKVFDPGNILNPGKIFL